jgi:hypothetical protein
MTIDIHELEHRLGELAMAFRGTEDPKERELIKDAYAATVADLIYTKHWEDMPAPEDMLPKAYMPAVFLAYWKAKYPSRQWRPAPSP